MYYINEIIFIFQHNFIEIVNFIFMTLLLIFL